MQNFQNPEDDESLKILVEIMRGYDRDRESAIYKLLAEIDDGFMDTPPTLSQWQEMAGLIVENYKQEQVPAKLRLKAAEVVAQYRHAKVKAIEPDSVGAAGVATTALTAAEIAIFTEQFNAEY